MFCGKKIKNKKCQNQNCKKIQRMNPNLLSLRNETLSEKLKTEFIDLAPMSNIPLQYHVFDEIFKLVTSSFQQQDI